jgi:WD40 repeat protein
MALRSGVVVLAAVLACDHSAPFGAPDTGANRPLGAGTPVQLTYSPGQEHTPGWVPDGSGFFFSEQRLDRPDRDRCLSELPPLGGRIERQLCHHTLGGEDSTDVFDSPAVGADGRIAFVAASSSARLLTLAPTYQVLLLAPLAHPDSTQVLLPIPYPSPSGRTHTGVSNLEWLPDGRLQFVGERVTYPLPDTVHTGVELMRLTTVAGQWTLSSLAGFDGVSSAAAAGDDTVYYSLVGDTRVFRRILSSGADTVLWDFGSEVGGGIARDLLVRGNRLIAVVGGMVYYTADSVLGASQRDNGGDIHVVDLTTGAEETLRVLDLNHPIWFRRPSLSPDGHLLVVEGRVYQLIKHTDEAGNLLFTDTIIDATPNLYEYRLP